MTKKIIFVLVAGIFSFCWATHENGITTSEYDIKKPKKMLLIIGQRKSHTEMR